MGLREWWKRFRASKRFDPERAAGRMPAVTIRPLRDEDIPACHAIYKANEEGRFPDNYFEKFEADLKSDGYLWLVVEDAGELVAVGGVCLHEYKSGTFGFLAFGMVSPDRHRQGIGSALLLARLAALSAPEGILGVGMTATPATVEFYKSYGFKYAGRSPEEDGNVFDTYYTLMSRPKWEACRVLLRSSGIDYDPDPLVVPPSPITL
ncbi:MAG: GNAT family N-acetyltransferase [Woeseiaceae bacterium]|nr:GNAT family N-acetyltransferase [Woeseiaceae bacterium]